MNAPSSCGSPTSTVTGTVAAAPRLFDRLDAPSKERVTLLLSRVRALLPIEQDAFCQELHRQLEEGQEAAANAKEMRGKLMRYSGPRLGAVQARDKGYVVPRALLPDGNQEVVGGGKASRQEERLPPITSSAAAAPPCSLEDLVHVPGMFGDAEVAIHLDKVSLYDKLHQNIADTNKPSAAPDDGTLAVVADAGASPVATARAIGPRTTGPYRNNAYQVVRLAMSSPGFIAIQKPSSTATAQTGQDGVRSVLNTTGLPINEDELREWFDELDEEGRGALSLGEFQRYMESLERDFGVTAEYVALQRDGEQLAFDGRLSFEAFAYLVLRFARM